MVFYRKYRPQTIDDLDSSAVREVLSSVLQKDTPHAFLFTGPKGLGKTSTARIIAKAVNCEKKGKGVEPCNECEQCVSITNGNNLDVIEIDAASNRGIDEIRDLKEKIRLAPIGAKKKVYIIDEVHMLTTEAFNALLKTLEEPPEHALFLLATTEPHKVPATILSRCFHIAFKPATEEELVRAFKRIVKGENLAISDEALVTIARLSEGGFRDGTKLLEELVLLANGKAITPALIEEKYQTVSTSSQVSELLDALIAKDAQQGMQVLTKVVSEGMDLKYLLQELMKALHEMLLLQVSGKKQKLSISEIRTLFTLLSLASSEMKYAVVPQLPLELAVIEYCSIETSAGETSQPVIASEAKQSHNKIAASSSTPRNDAEEKVVSKVSVVEEVTVHTLRKQVGVIKRNEAIHGVEKVPPKEKRVVLPRVELMHVPAKGEMTPEWLESLWYHIIEEVRTHNHTVAGVLRSCVLKQYDGTDLVIQTAYKFHKERLDDMKTRESLLHVCKILTGNEVAITVELKNS